MIAGVDWSAVAEQHHRDEAGECSCGVAACRMLAQVDRRRREDERELLPGPPPLSRPFTSVFAPGEVER